MKVELTEKEAREKLAHLLTGQHAPYPWEALPDPQWEAVKAAWGLEFAPESPKLPEGFRLSADGLFLLGKSPAGWFTVASFRPLGELWEPEATKALVVGRLAAYAGLRRVAERVVGYLKRNDGTGMLVLEAEAELAKGPKRPRPGSGPPTPTRGSGRS